MIVSVWKNLDFTSMSCVLLHLGFPPVFCISWNTVRVAKSRIKGEKKGRAPVTLFCMGGLAVNVFSFLDPCQLPVVSLSGVVHLTGGVAGLAGTTILGPRKGRFTNPEEFECHNLPLVVLGTFILWFGWYGFNSGSTLTMKSGSDGALAAQVSMNTTLAAATGGLTVFLLRYVIMKTYDVLALCNGILAGLVSISAGCGNMESGCAFATGLIGGFVYQAASMLLKKLKIDDPVDASAVHGFCGAWGLLAAGLFDWGKGFDHYHGRSGFGCMENDDGSCKSGIGDSAIAGQAIMILVIVAWSGSLSAMGFFVLKKTGLRRSSEYMEEVGSDCSPHKAHSMRSGSHSPSTMTSEHETAAI